MSSKYFRILLLSFGLLFISNVQAESLLRAVFASDLKSVKSLLREGADINKLERYIGGSALHVAARSGQHEMAQLLIDSGARVDLRDRSDYTPLHNAAWVGTLDMVKLLLNAGADINAATYSGRTPLSCAQDSNKAEVIEFIQGRLQLATN